MKKFLVLLTLVAVCFTFAACTFRMVDFTVISSKNCDVKGKMGKRVKGSDGKCSMVGIPNLKEALDRAIQQEPGADALVDGVVYWKYYYVWNVYEVEGTALNTKAR